MEIKKIYFDMDGVLADFARGVKEICGLEPISQNAKNNDSAEEDRMWNAIRDAGHFYDKLELMPGAKEMFDALYLRYGDRCEILTGIPKPKRGIDSAGDDKKAWVKRLLSKDIKVNIVYREEKARFCTGKDCILIDDFDKNIREWEAMGGTGIMNVTADESMAELKKLGISAVATTDPRKALEYIEKRVRGRETLIFKGSQYLEWIIEKLLANPKDAKKLCRRERAAVARRKSWGLDS